MSPDPKTPIEVVVLLHGIRTRATWYDLAKESLQTIPNLEVRTVGYGRFDLFRFLLPFTRHAPKKIVLREIRAIKWALEKSDVKFRISVLAHSFGTYNILQILEQEDDLDLHHLILCGSVIRTNYDFLAIGRKISGN